MILIIILIMIIIMIRIIVRIIRLKVVVSTTKLIQRSKIPPYVVALRLGVPTTYGG